MKIIIGLGNPGKEYDGTRHNIGFAITDKIKAEWNFSEWEFNKKFNAAVAKNSSDVLLVKPQTFMNLSGDAVRSVLDFYKLTPDAILVIHDDLDLAAGKYKFATDSSSAGHNGVENIIEKLGTQKFRRVRIGIGEETPEGAVICRINAHDFVLQKFSEEELEKIKKISDDILNEIKKLLL